MKEWRNQTIQERIMWNESRPMSRRLLLKRIEAFRRPMLRGVLGIVNVGAG